MSHFSFLLRFSNLFVGNGVGSSCVVAGDLSGVEREYEILFTFFVIGALFKLCGRLLKDIHVLKHFQQVLSVLQDCLLQADGRN